MSIRKEIAPATPKLPLGWSDGVVLSPFNVPTSECNFQYRELKDGRVVEEVLSWGSAYYREWPSLSEFRVYCDHTYHNDIEHEHGKLFPSDAARKARNEAAA